MFRHEHVAEQGSWEGKEKWLKHIVLLYENLKKKL